MAAVEKTVETFGGLDICINNASAISMTGTEATPIKRYDLMHQVNARGTYLTSQVCIPHLKKAENPHILNLASPLNMNPRWFGPHVAYTMAKYGMSMCVLGMAEEFKGKIGVNGLWPNTVINTAALQMIPGVNLDATRLPSIMADAAHVVLTRDHKTCTGNFFIDEEVLRQEGVTDFEQYASKPGVTPMPDLFLD